MNQQSYSILVVEDDKEIRQGIEIYLRNQGYQVYQASNGVEGLEVIKSRELHLVILDVMMPVMDGYQVLKAIRNIEKQKKIPKDKCVKVVMTTALNEERNVKMAFDLGCEAYVGKPIDVEKFEKVLKKLGLI